MVCSMLRGDDVQCWEEKAHRMMEGISPSEADLVGGWLHLDIVAVAFKQNSLFLDLCPFADGAFWMLLFARLSWCDPGMPRDCQLPLATCYASRVHLQECQKPSGLISQGKEMRQRS